jgi:AcrR family transcriptional regulator
MPKLWTETIREHRQAVHDTILDAAAALVREHGLAGVTMSQIAAASGIGRATLYKYFPDVEAILVAWHERQIACHLDQLSQVRASAGPPAAQLEAILTAYALIQHQHHDTDLPAALLHRGGHVAQAWEHLHAMLADLITAAASDGQARADIPPGELATYCLHALAAAGALPTQAAARRLAALTLTALRPPHDQPQAP